MRANYIAYFIGGMAAAACAIGFFLISIAVGIELFSDSGSSMLRHPLYRSGISLISTSALTGVFVFAMQTWKCK